MNKVLGLGLLGFGAWIFYKMLGEQGAVTGNGISIITSNGDTPISNVSLADLKSKMLAASNNASQLNADGWAYYFNALSSHGAITPTDFERLFIIPQNGDRSKTYSIDEFLAITTQSGLNGLDCLRGIQGEAFAGTGWSTGLEHSIRSGNSPNGSWFERSQGRSYTN